jgi:ABC-2 type transport system permease protein
MDKLAAVIKREYLERVRNKWFVIVTIFGPVFFAAIMILPAFLTIRGIQGARVEELRIVDATGTDLGRRFAVRLASPPRDSTPEARARADSVAAQLLASVTPVAPESLAAEEERLTAAVVANDMNGFLVLDSTTLATGRARYAGRNAGSVGENERYESAVRGAVLSYRLEHAGVDTATARSITAIRARVSTERITDKGRGGSGLAGMIFGFVIAFFLYMALILYGQAILRGVLEEKTTRVAEVIVASVRPDILLAGKVIGVGAVGLTQFGIWLLSGSLLWGARLKLMGAVAGPAAAAQIPSNFVMPTIEPFTILALLLYFLLGYTFYASLFAAVGAMVSTQEEANQAAQPVMMLLVASIIFVQPVMTNPNGGLAEVMSWLPFSAPIIMPLRMTATPVPVYEVLASLAGVALACVAAIWVAARIYRVGLLMYGKRPTLRELGRWIRQA